MKALNQVKPRACGRGVWKITVGCTKEETNCTLYPLGQLGREQSLGYCKETFLNAPFPFRAYNPIRIIGHLSCVFSPYFILISFQKEAFEP